MRVGRVRLIWVLLVLLAAFVLFTECIADIGGNAEPIPRPPQSRQLEDYGGAGPHWAA